MTDLTRDIVGHEDLPFLFRSLSLRPDRCDFALPTVQSRKPFQNRFAWHGSKLKNCN